MTKVAVLGCGYWGANVIRTFADIGALACVADPDAAAAQALGDRHGVAVASLDEVLADHGVPAVAITAPAASHADLARRCLEAGKDVFVEKPLALRAVDGEEVVALAAAGERVLQVGHLMRYHPAFVELARLVESEALGRLQYIYSNRLNLGRFRREENALWSFAPHDISMILALVGSEPDEVTAVGGTYLRSGVADVTTTHLAFPGGERAHVFVSWLHPYKEQKLVVVGSEAMAVLDDGEPWATKLRVYQHRIAWPDGSPAPDKALATPIALVEEEPLRLECQHFLDCIATRSTPRTDGEEGLRVLRTLERAQASLTGSPA